MNIEGLDYNTQREQLVLPEYGREVQKMVDHAVGLPSKEERQHCAETIVAIMDRMFPQNRENPDYKQKLWDHLAIMSNFQLDIDWPFDISGAAKIATKQLFEQLKTMPPGEERDELVRETANQMKRNLYQWSQGSADDEKIASDLARFTDGRIQLDIDSFVFDKLDFSQAPQQSGKKKRR